MNINFVPPTRKTETVYRGKRINIRCDWVDCNLGELVLREVIEHPGAVIILATDDDKNIILVRQYRHAIGRVLFECPAGTREAGEDALTTAQREFLEEANFEASNWKYLGELHPMPGISDEVQSLFYATGLVVRHGETDPGEFIDVHKFSLARIKEMIINSEITDSKSIACIFRAELLGLLK